MAYDPLDGAQIPPYALDERAEDDFAWLVRHAQGRRIVRQLLMNAGVWRSSFHADPYQMAFNEGMRTQGLKLLGAVAQTDEFYLILKGEADD